MRDEHGRGGRGPRDRRPRFDDDEDDRPQRRDGRPRFDDLDDDDEPRRGRAPSRGPARRKPQPQRKPAQPGFFARLFGGAPDRRLRRRSRDENWDFVDDDAEDRRGGGRFSRESWDEDDLRRKPRRRQQTLMELCTPVFAYAAVLPRDAGGMHPSYGQFRNEVLTALQRIESEAQEAGIDR